MNRPGWQIIVMGFLFAALVGVSQSCVFIQPTAQKQTPETKPEVKGLLPQPAGFVNDYANVFDSDSKSRLESQLVKLKEKAKIEFAVVTIATTNGEPISDYSLKVAKEWGVGPKDSSQGGGGLLLMFAVQDREWRLQVSRSLEKDLPDDVCKQLGDESRELYQQGKYVEGMEKYVNAIIRRLEQVKKFSLDS